MHTNVLEQSHRLELDVEGYGFPDVLDRLPTCTSDKDGLFLVNPCLGFTLGPVRLNAMATCKVYIHTRGRVLERTRLAQIFSHGESRLALVETAYTLGKA